MSEPREPLARIVIAGDGPLGTLAAIALKRALPPAQVVVIGIPHDPTAFADLSATALPFSNWLHDRLGISEETLVRRCGASHRLVTRFLGGEGDSGGVVAYGAEVDPKLETGFARNWGAGPRNAAAMPEPGSVAEVLAGSDRFAPPSQDPASLGGIDYALRWNVPAYRELLIATAHGLGVQHAQGTVSAVEPDGSGGIVSLMLDVGTSVQADLFVDCSGPEAALLSRLPDARWLDWSRQLPTRSVAFAKPGAPMLALEDRLSLTEFGWRWEIAGRDGRQAILLSGGGAGDDAIRTALGVEPSETASLSPRCAAQPWIGNVVALGDAAAHLEPTAGFALDLAHRQIGLLLELLPGRAAQPMERAEYNRRARLMADGTRDAIALHYAGSAARAVYGEIELSDELRVSLDQWARRGRVPFFEDSPLLTQEWAGLLRALGFPAGQRAIAYAEDPREGEARTRAFAAKAQAALRSMPPYGDWMNRALAG